MVRSVESIVDLLQTHLKLNINLISAEVLKLNYDGNAFLKSGDVDQAIDCYDKAIELGDKEQEGILLAMRGQALLQRAYSLKLKLKDIFAIMDEVIPTIEAISLTILAFSSLDASIRHRAALDMLNRVHYVFRNIDSSPKWVSEYKLKWLESKDNGVVITSGEQLVERGNFVYSLYEHALMRALQDLLSATIVLPGFGQAWRRAGEALSEYGLYREAIEYYEVAMKLDESLYEDIYPIIVKLQITESLIEKAALKGWHPDSILALID